MNESKALVVLLVAGLVSAQKIGAFTYDNPSSAAHFLKTYKNTFLGFIPDYSIWNKHGFIGQHGLSREMGKGLIRLVDIEMGEKLTDQERELLLIDPSVFIELNPDKFNAFLAAFQRVRAIEEGNLIFALANAVSEDPRFNTTEAIKRELYGPSAEEEYRRDHPLMNQSKSLQERALSALYSGLNYASNMYYGR